MKYGIVIDIETTGYKRTKTVFYNSDGRKMSEAEMRAIPPEQVYLYNHEEILDDSAEIVSVGYLRVDLDADRIFDAGVLYFYKPYFHIENDAQKIHKLQRSFLEQYEDQFQTNLAILESLLINSIIIGKNCDAFDIPYIEAFLKKHRGGKSLYPYINSQGMKNYDKKKLVLENNTTSYDVQTKFAPLYRGLMRKVHGVELSERKKGTLTEYIELLDPERKDVNTLIEEIKSLTSDEFCASAHDAMYDVAMTYVVFKFLQEVAKRRNS